MPKLIPMMNYKYLVIGCLAFSSLSLHAQDKALTMEDAVLGLRGGQFTPESLKQLQWKKQEPIFTYITKNNALVQQHANTNRLDTLLQLATLNKTLFGKDSLKSFPNYIWTNNGNIILSHQNNRYYINQIVANNWQLNRNFDLPKDASNLTWDNQNNQIAYTEQNNLVLIDKHNNKKIVAQSKQPNIVIGQSVHRNEFGINNGIFFSPKDNFIAYYHMDESMVADYPIINWSTIPATLQNIKYPMAGGTSHQVKIGVYNIQAQQTIYLDIEAPKDQYLTNISWSPDEQYIFVGILNRAQNHLRWNQYNAVTGKFVKTLFEEQHPKYVEPQHPLHFITEKEFVWMSQRDGYMHLYRYNLEGKLLNQITKGKWIVTAINGKNDISKELIITTTKDDVREKHIYAVNWVNGKLKKLSQQDGTHQALVNQSGQYVLDIYQNATTPRNTDLIRIDKQQNKTIHSSPNKLADYYTAPVESVVLKADDGTDLYGKLIKPKNFDPKKKYPVIVYLYNGPHLQLITNTYPASGNLWYDYLSQEGYIVFTMDGRGSSNRGFEFESAVHRKLGQTEMLDQLKGVEFLKSLPYVDGNKLGIHGWSFGGFMTTSLMTHYPDVFKVGVAGGPVIDWGMYEVMYTERYMGTPQNNKEGYELTELSSKVDKIKGNLMVIHGADDDVVVLQHAMKLLDASVKKNKQLDFYVYPGHKHNVVGKDRVHLMQKITDYFNQHLK